MRRALIVGALLSIVIAGYAMTFDSEDSLFPLKSKPGLYYPSPLWQRIGASFALGMGLGTLLILIRSNRTRMRAVLRPNKGRVVCAIVFALVLPVWQFWGIPIVLGYLVIGIFGIGSSWYPAEVLGVVGIVFGTLLASYVTSSLIISGAHRRFVRIALFGQMWLAVYAVTLLVGGVYIY